VCRIRVSQTLIPHLVERLTCTEEVEKHGCASQGSPAYSRSTPFAATAQGLAKSIEPNSTRNQPAEMRVF
jgi:hypothetical protein